MCRIAGIIDFNNSLNGELEERLISMRDSMSHGGPDGAGVFISEDKKIGLAHRRLAILDLSPNGHQPMSNSDKTIWIIHNGEIFNFQEIKKELITLGYKFKSNTDTEVLIYGYERWGIEKLLGKLHGMFAFAIYDSRDTNKIIIARDRIGIKPVYYYQDKNRFIFASEVRGIMKSGLVEDKKNTEALIRFLQLGSVPQPFTTIKNVFSLPAGHYLTISTDGIAQKKYWELSDCFSFNNLNKQKESREEIIENTRERLLKAFNLRLVSDTPLGIFLSGGIDSSALVALSRRAGDIKPITITVDFDEADYSEAKYARLIAEKFNTDHHEFILRKNDFYRELPEIIKAMDQPTVDGINTYFISKFAKELGLKVGLSGIGGDEVFLGYNHFKNASLIYGLTTLLKRLSAQERKFILGCIPKSVGIVTKSGIEKLNYVLDQPTNELYFLFRGLFTPSQIQKILGISEKEFLAFEPLFKFNNWNDLSSFKSITHYLNYLDIYHYLQDQILKDTDFMSMHHGVEIRIPYLDYRLIEYVASIESGIKAEGGRNKFLIGQIVNELPSEIINRKKMGFVFPFAIWLRKGIAEINLNQTKSCVSDKIFFNTLVDDFLKGKVHWSRLWGLYIFERFLNQSWTKTNIPDPVAKV